MQTIERPPAAPGKGPRTPTIVWVLVAVVALPILVLAVLSQVGAFVLLGVAVIAGLLIWVWRKGFLFVEMMAFLIHFDGIGFGPVRLGRILAGVALVVIAIRLVRGWKPLAIPPRTWVPVWLFTAWAIISGFWSAQIGGWFFTMAVYGLGVTYFFVAALLVDDHSLVQKFLRAYWVGGLFGSGAGILALFLGTRSVGFGGDPNFFGLLQASMIPLTVYYRRNATTLVAKRWYTFALLVVLAGAAGAGSRSGLIGGAAVIVATMVTRPGLSMARRGGVAIGSLIAAGIAFIVGFIANPANLERGFTDRGAGRLDMWGATVGLIQESPLVGYGFGQIRSLLPQEMLVSPGSQFLTESRTDVSAHNTWLDVQADLGLIGLAIFVTVILVAIVGFIWPRWVETRELSTTMLVMMVPVITGSFFLPLLNNKLAWVLVGLSAALQAPSWASRWPGWARAAAASRSEPGMEVELASLNLSTGPPVAGALSNGSAPAPHPEVTGGVQSLPPVRLARWDLSLRWPFIPLVIAAAVLGGVIGGAAAPMVPTTYTGSTHFVVPRIDGTPSTGEIFFRRTRLQTVLTAGVSLPYAAEVARLANLDDDPHTIAERFEATRPGMGMNVEVAYTAEDRDEVARVQEVLGPAMDNLFEAARESSVAQAENEMRPIVPGESRVYQGPTYIHSYEHSNIVENPPRTGWFVFVGFVSAAVLSAGLGLMRQRRARVSVEDDLDEAIGVPVWARLGWGRPWTRVSKNQTAQILTAAADAAVHEDPARRFFVVGDSSGGVQRRVALAITAALLDQGRRVVLVDAEVHRGALSRRMGLRRNDGVRQLARGQVGLAEIIERPSRRRLPGILRRSLQGHDDQLRIVPAGRLSVASVLSNRFGSLRDDPVEVPVDAFEVFTDDVTVVMLGAVGGGATPSSDAMEWADAVVLAADVGRTPTDELDAAAADVHLYSNGVSGVVLINA